MKTTPYEDGIKIAASKRNILLYWIGSITFVAISILLLPENTVMAGLCLAFSGLGVLVFSVTIFHRQSGLYINPEGINMITPFASNSMIGWNEIRGFGIIAINRTRLVAVYLKNPEAFLQKQSSWKQVLGKMSYNLSGTPFSISPSLYGCSADELQELLNTKLKEYKLEKAR